MRPIECSTCEAKFTRTDSLTCHIATVHEGKKFAKCRKCDADFSQNCCLKNHTALVHEGKSPLNAIHVMPNLA